MDLTRSYKQLVLQIHRSRGIPQDKDEISRTILKRKSDVSPSPFTNAARALYDEGLSIKNALIAKKDDYLDIHKFISTEASLMTDGERDQLEEDVDIFIENQMKKIEILKGSIGQIEQKEDADSNYNNDQNNNNNDNNNKNNNNINNNNNNHNNDDDSRLGQDTANCIEHKHGVVLHLMFCTKDIAEIRKQLKEQRTQQQKDRLERLKTSQFDTGKYRSEMLQRNAARRHQDKKNGDKSRILDPALDGWLDENGEEILDSDDEDELTLIEQQEFMDENTALLDTLETNLDNIRKAEKKLVEISSMMSDFSARVMEQTELIDSIYDTSVQSTSHLKKGTAELQTATERGVNYRLMMLFFLVGASLSLLFLDWMMT